NRSVRWMPLTSTQRTSRSRSEERSRIWSSASSRWVSSGSTSATKRRIGIPSPRTPARWSEPRRRDGSTIAPAVSIGPSSGADALAERLDPARTMHYDIRISGCVAMRGLPELFKALADSTRLRVLRLLDEAELNVNELVEVLEVPQPTVSRHLGVLLAA